jgi:endonuclease G
MKRIFLVTALLLSLSCKSDENIQPKENNSLEPKSKGEIIKHTYYTLAYSEDDEQAYWVFYHLTPELINGTQTRTDDFRADPAVSTGSATLIDYKGSGFDRGHLCPAADMALNKTSMSESFYLSNMSPQNASFNRGIWSKLEDQVRVWALEDNGLYVTTGGILNEKIGWIGINEVSVPAKYYKVLYSEKSGMIGLVLPNEGSQKPLSDFVISVDSVETLTGINFFPGLEDEIENQLEGNVNVERWVFR